MKLYYHSSDYTKVLCVDKADVRPTRLNGADKWDYVYVKRGKGEMLVRTYATFDECAADCLHRITGQVNEGVRRYQKKKAQLERLKENIKKGAG